MLALPNSVIREFDRTWVQLALNDGTASATEGFRSCSPMTDTCASYWFAQPRCEGPTYFAGENHLFQDAMVIDGEIRFPAGPVTSRELKSFEIDNGECWEVGGNLTGDYCEANVCAAALSDRW